MKRWPLVASFVLFIVLCASVAYWAMQLFKPPLRPVAAPPKETRPAPQLDAAAGLFGGRSTVAVATNFQLHGVVVSGNPADSVAILTADGKPAQAVRLSREVIPGVTVKEVHRGYVLLSEGGVDKRVELPQDVKTQAKANAATNAPLPARTAPATPPTVVVSPPPQQEQAVAPNAAAPPAPPNTPGAAAPSNEQPPPMPQPPPPEEAYQPDQPPQRQ